MVVILGTVVSDPTNRLSSLCHYKPHQTPNSNTRAYAAGVATDACLEYEGLVFGLRRFFVERLSKALGPSEAGYQNEFLEDCRLLGCTC